MSEERIPDLCISHTEEIVKLKSRVSTLETAFPDGVANHRRAHEDMIAAAMADRRFLGELKLDAAKKGMWVFILVILGLLWIGIETKVKAFFGIGGH